MDVFVMYTHGTAAWLATQAVLAILVPKLIIALLSTEAHGATDLEVYFTRSWGFAMVTISLVALLFTGTIPLSSSIAEPLTTEEGDAKAPYAVPVLYLTTLFHSLMTTYCWVRYTALGTTGFVLGALGYAGLACMGGWCVMFGSSGGRISKRTGADKRTTGFPFKNANAYNKHKDRKMG